MSVAVLQRHQTVSMGCWWAFLRSWDEDLTNIVRKRAAAAALGLGRQMMLNPVMDEFGRRAEIKFTRMSGAVGADDLAAEGDLVGEAQDGLSLSQQPQNLHLSVREKLMRRRRMGAV